MVKVNRKIGSTILSGFACRVAGGSADAQGKQTHFGSPVQRANHAPAALVQYVGVNHRCGNIRVAEQLLHGSDNLAQSSATELNTHIGGQVFKIDRSTDLPNAFGKADIFGGKVNRGYTELRYQGTRDNRLGDVRPNNITEYAAWSDAISAATEWKKKACSNTKGEFNDKAQKWPQPQQKCPPPRRSRGTLRRQAGFAPPS